MTLANITFITSIAVVNLTLGFGAAALVGRGPWSRRASFHKPFSPGENELEVASTDVHSDGLAGPARVVQSIQHVAGKIELVEQVLQALMKQIQEVGDRDKNDSLLKWAAAITDLSHQLSSIHDEFHRITEQDGLSAEVRNPTLEALESMQHSFQVTGDEFAKATKTGVDRCESIDRLLAACQKVRGAMNAVSFFESQS